MSRQFVGVQAPAWHWIAVPQLGSSLLERFGARRLFACLLAFSLALLCFLCFDLLCFASLCSALLCFALLCFACALLACSPACFSLFGTCTPIAKSGLHVQDSVVAAALREAVAVLAAALRPALLQQSPGSCCSSGAAVLSHASLTVAGTLCARNSNSVFGQIAFN